MKCHWIWAVAGLVAGLAGCSGPTAVTASTEFNRYSDKGIVILGVRRESGLFERGQAVLRFVRVDRERALLVADTGRQANDFRIVRSGGRGVVDHVDGVGVEGDREFFLYTAPPGDYYLYTVQWGDTGFQIMERGSFIGTVGPGEVAYWGDITVGQPEELLGDVQLSYAGLDAAAAQTALDRFPNLLAEMTVRPLEPAALDCDLGGEGSIFGEFLLADDACYGGSI